MHALARQGKVERRGFKVQPSLLPVDAAVGLFDLAAAARGWPRTGRRGVQDMDALPDDNEQITRP